MDLRPRLRQSFSGFTKAEVQKLEQSLNDFNEQTLEDEFCKKLARLFNRSSGRAGKPVVKWTEIQSWFQKNQEQGREASLDKAKKLHAVPETHTQNKATGNQKLPEGEEDVEFEARSSKDGAWKSL